MGRKSASQLAAEQEYFRKHNIPFEVKVPKKEKQKVIIEKRQEQGIVYGLGKSTKSFGIYIAMGNMASVKPLKYMNDNELIPKLLADYESILKNINGIGNHSEAIQFLFKINAHEGICMYARNMYSVDVTERWWITQFQEEPEGFWYRIPEYAYGFEEVVDSIQYRVDKLKEILN